MAGAAGLAKRGLESYLALTSPLRMRPDFLIIGAQRCGTTSLYRYLAEHPAVVPTLVSKGVHYFSTSYERGPAWYRGHFPLEAYRRARALSGTERVLTGEASPYYVFHPLAPARVAADLPQTRLIVMLRDPVGRAYSHYQHEREGGFEDLSTFEEAVAAEPDRLAGEEERIVADPGYQSFHHQHHSYLARGRYAEQLARWLDVVPRERLLVVRSEDLFRDLDGTYARVLGFLGLPPWTVERQTAYNAHTYEAMRPETKKRLRAAFEPHEQALARLLDEGSGP
jgi:hypothetical protein